MQNRDLYTKVEDFLSDESFQNWVKNKEDVERWEEWTLENTKRAKLVAEARLCLLAMKIEETPISDNEIQARLQRTWKTINRSTRNPMRVVKQANWLKYAAALLLFGVAPLAYYLSDRNSKSDSTITYQKLIEQESDGLIEQANNSDKSHLITLSDASSILLQPKSKLSYPKTFKGDTRKVYLSGEGFFEISKDPKKHFYVYANEVITRVYGTSFKVVAYPNQSSIEVLVRTGKVSVSSQKNIGDGITEEVTLLPNQAARFLRKELLFEKILDVTQDKPLVASVKTVEQLSFEFKDIPVYQILRTIEQAYLVKIDFPEEKLKDCYLTTSLSDEPLPEKLKIICESLGNNTRYEMNGNQITILSNGCH